MSTNSRWLTSCLMRKRPAPDIERRSDPMSAPMTWEFVLRTFKRLDMIARRIDAEVMAKELLAHHPKASFPTEYLADVWYYLRKFTREAGGDINAHPNGNCPQCGEGISRDHNGARYCSDRCRQRAYRVRKAVAEGRNSPIPKRRRQKPTRKEAAIREAMEGLAREKEALVFANQMYALHLRAHPGETKHNTTAISDTSPR